MSTAPTRPMQAAVRDWREFGSRRYRRFHVLAVAQGLIGSLSGPAVVLPLLLALGAHPALATLIAVLPVVGTTVQRLVPNVLERTGGNLRGIVILAAALGEPRGLLLAGVVAATAGGILPRATAIGLVAAVIATQGSVAAVGYGLLQSWYVIILPDEERRLVGPRLAGITLGIGAVILLPLSLVIDGWLGAIGLYAYAVPLGIAGIAGVASVFIERGLPTPGRVHVPRRTSWHPRQDPRLWRLARVLMLASLAGGLSPFLTVYAISVLGTGAGFAIAISAVSSGSLVAASILVSSHLRLGSASRLLRLSFVIRGCALLLGIAALPSNPVAPALLLLIAVLLATGDTAGQLAANERLFRLATGPSVIAFQSGFVVQNVGAYAAGMLAASGIMLLGGYLSFAILFGAAGTVRFVAARVTELSPGSEPAAGRPGTADDANPGPGAAS